MNDIKAWYQSRTIWGSLITLAATLLAAFGFELDASAQKQLLSAILQIVTVAGTLFAIFGRLNATTVIE